MRLVPRLGAAGRARVCACVAQNMKDVFFPLVRRLAGLGGPWRPKKHTQTTTGLPYAAACFVKCVFPAVSKASFVALNSRWSLSIHDADADAKSALVRSDPLWSALVRSGPLRFAHYLVHFDPFWSILIRPGPSFLFLYILDPGSLACTRVRSRALASAARRLRHDPRRPERPGLLLFISLPRRSITLNYVQLKGSKQTDK